MTKLYIANAACPPGTPSGPGDVTMIDVKNWVRSGAILSHVARYSRVELSTPNLDTMRRPLVTELVVRSMSSGSCVATDWTGRARSIGGRELTMRLCDLIRDASKRRSLLRSVEADLLKLSRPARSPSRANSGRAVYLRTDLDFGLRSGGSVGHTAGVVNNLGRSTRRVAFIAPDSMPMISVDVDVRIVLPQRHYWDFRDLPEIAYSRTIFAGGLDAINGELVGLVYQRYSAYNYAGLALARRLRVPFVLEYNGSAVWIGRHWSTRLRHEALAERIELLNVRSADLVVVVSEPMQDELIQRGVDPRSILVNPNGVDPDVYSPSVDSSAIRSQYGLDGKFVVGFIGTFEPWHGADVLADAFLDLIRRRPELRSSLRLMMIGDGPGLAPVRRVLEEGGLSDLCVFSGRTAQEDGPAHLAACDIFASPHVPNADGSRFFGSPTKLFEYMAMGRGIVASDLDQIGEILEDGRTALLVGPGNANSLSSGLARLIDDRELRERLGHAAREEALAKYTWKEHTSRILHALDERLA